MSTDAHIGTNGLAQTYVLRFWIECSQNAIFWRGRVNIPGSEHIPYRYIDNVPELVEFLQTDLIRVAGCPLASGKPNGSLQ